MPQALPAALEGLELHVVPEVRPAIVWEQMALPRALRRVGADVYHALANLGAPLAGPCPSVLTVHDLIPWTSPIETAWARASYRWRLQASVRAAAAIVTVSAATRRTLLERIPGVAPRVHVVQCGVAERFRPIDAAGEALVRERYGLDARRRRYFLWIGFPQPHKNLARLFAAYGRLDAATRAAFPLVVAGPPGPDLAAYPWWGDAPIPAEVRVLGFVPEGDMPALLGGARALALPSLEEGFGLPALEAMACGTPVVAGDRASLPEIVGDAGLLVDPTSVDAILTALVRLATDAALASELGRRAATRGAGARWEQAVARMVELYRQVSAGEPPLGGPTPA